MSFLKKTWLARLGVGLNRFRMNNSTDVVLESNPVSVTQQGDQLSADNMNNLETRIDNAFTEMAGNLAPIEVSPATTNHAVGTQLVYNGILYKVTSAISTGNNLVVGSNISPYPVSSALSDIMSLIPLRGALVKYKNNLTSWAYSNFESGITISLVTQLATESPQAYPYGVLITVRTDESYSWEGFQIYAPDSQSATKIYFRNMGSSSWASISY